MRGLALLAVGPALLLAACGGDDSGSEGAFVADADAICTELAERELAAYAESAGPEISIAYLERIRDERAAALERLDALEAPEDMAAGFDEFTAKLAQSNQVIADAVAAVADERAGDFAAARVEARERRLEANEIGAGIGLGACAGVLPTEDEEQVRETLELTIDPSAAKELCTERATEAFIAARFDSATDCVDQQSADTGIEEVTVEGLHGVEGVSANLQIELSAANGDSAEYEASLAFEDGTWKLNSLAPASASG